MLKSIKIGPTLQGKARYAVNGFCTNCNAQYNLLICKTVTVKRAEYNGKAECLLCECKTVEAK